MLHILDYISIHFQTIFRKELHMLAIVSWQLGWNQIDFLTAPLIAQQQQQVQSDTY